MYRPLLLASLSLLGACQSANPYRADSQPAPPAPAQAAGHFDATAYPAAPTDFTRLRSWQWQQPAPAVGQLNGAEVAEVLAAELEQRGLRPARAGAPADLSVNLSSHEERRVYQDVDRGGAYYGQGPWGDHYGAYGSVPLRREWEVRVQVVEIRLYRTQTAELLWSTRAETRAGNSLAEQRDSLRQAVHNALSDYPPH